MTVYSDSTFAKESGLAASEIKGSPSVEIQRENGDTSFQPSSVDLHLDDEFLAQTETTQTIRVDEQKTYPRYDFQTTNDNGYYDIHPGQFVLATTQETVHLNESVVGFLWGRSSVGRLGIFAHNAGLIDAGFGPAELTLELFNASPNTIALKEGMRIVQMTVHELTEDSPNDYSEKVESKYNDQQSVTPSRLYKDFQ